MGQTSWNYQSIHRDFVYSNIKKNGTEENNVSLLLPVTVDVVTWHGLCFIGFDKQAHDIKYINI